VKGGPGFRFTGSGADSAGDGECRAKRETGSTMPGETEMPTPQNHGMTIRNTGEVAFGLWRLSGNNRSEGATSLKRGWIEAEKEKKKGGHHVA